MPASSRRTQLPDSFAVRERVREYTARAYGLYHLADVMGAEFLAYHKRRNEAGKPARYSDWTAALVNYIKGEAPPDAPGDGRFHNPKNWARWCAQARDMERTSKRAGERRDARDVLIDTVTACAPPGRELELPLAEPAPRAPAPAPRPAPAAVAQHLAAARELLAAARPIPTKQRRSRP